MDIDPPVPADCYTIACNCASFNVSSLGFLLLLWKSPELELLHSYSLPSISYGTKLGFFNTSASSSCPPSLSLLLCPNSN